MFSFLRKKNEKEKLQALYAKLMEESFHLSRKDRVASDAKVAEAEIILEKIKTLEQKQG